MISPACVEAASSRLRSFYRYAMQLAVRDSHKKRTAHRLDKPSLK